MAQHLELNPVSHLTVNTVGPPGQRVFYIQGSRGAEVVSLIMEKQQANMLANGFESLLEELADRFPNAPREAPDTVWTDLRLREPLEPLVRIGNMGLGFNDEANKVVLVAYELVEEDDEPNVVSFWISRNQIRSLIPHIREVVSAGRPICGNCGQPMEPEGHFCPRRNGYHQ
jgi:uncharacterized repeat protein (TIGR03847 family)